MVLPSPGTPPGWAANLVNGLKRSNHGITVAANDTAAFLKQLADYTCDAVNDEVQIQAAIDEAQTYVVGGVGAPDVRFLPGTYRIGAGITKKTARLIGAAGYNIGVRFVWDGGADTGTMITQDVTQSPAFCHIENINFRNGTNHPFCFVDISYVDQATRLVNVSFVGGTEQLRIGNYANCQLTDHMRFDHWRGYAIALYPSTTQSASNFVLADFTADHNNTTVGTEGFGFLKIAQPSVNNLGPIVLRGGRIEVNAGFRAPNALVHVDFTGGASQGARTVPLSFDDLAIYEGVNMTALVYRSNAGTTNSDQMAIRNTQVGRATLPMFGGTWPASWPTGMVVPNNAGEVIVQQAVQRLEVTEERTRLAQTNIVERSKAAASTTWEFQQWATGRMEWGGGAVAPDVTLFRSTANVLSVDTDDCLRTGRNVTGSRPAASSVGVGAQFFDTTLNKPIWSDGTNWRDAAGTVV